MLNKAWSTGPASQISGVPRRTLARWAQEGFLIPSAQDTDGRGSSRLFTFTDLVAARTAQALRKQGVYFGHIRKVVHNLRELGFKHGNPLARAVLVVRGKDVQLVTGDNLISVLAEPGQFALAVVDLGSEIEYIKQGIEQLQATM